MGLESAVIAAIGAGASVVGTVAGIANNQSARREQKKVQAVQNASNRAQQLEEQRRQIREERVKRARILQASENTGVTGGSGEAGAIGSLSTQLSSNLGYNQGAVNRASDIGVFQQNAADAAGRAQLWSAFGQMAPSALSVGNSIFSNNTPTDLQGPLINQQFPNQ